jgi:hypothetical protein
VRSEGLPQRGRADAPAQRDRPLWIRLEPTRRENLKSAAIAVAAGAVVGSVTFYLTRLLLARRELAPARPESRRDRER